MKRFLSILLALVMLLSMAACAKTDSSDKENETETKLETESNPAEESIPDEESTPEAESIPEEESTPLPEAQKPPIPSTETEVLPLSVMLGNDCLVNWDENNNRLAYIEWNEVYLEGASAEEYRQLVDALNYVNRGFRGWGDTNLVALTEQAKTDVAKSGEGFPGYEASSNVYVQRADSRVISLLSQYVISDGQAMGSSYTYEGVNLDTATGLQVPIDLVLTDMDSLPQLLEDALTKKYADYPEGAFSGIADKLKSYTPWDYNWTISYQGVTFYFDEQELLTPHDGSVSVTLWFADHPDLFVDAYTQCPKNGYALPLPQGVDVEVDVKSDDGKTDRLSVTLNEDESLQIELNQSLYLDDCFGYYCNAYLVTPDNRNFYLYIEGVCLSDDWHMRVYGLKSGQVVHLTSSVEHFSDVRAADARYTRFFNDPTNFSLSFYTYTLSTLTAARTYHIDPKTGLPQPDTEHYSYILPKDWPPLTSLIPLEVEILPNKTDETLPAGTKFHFLRTDDKTYVDMRLDDGRECRIYVDPPDWDLRYETYVNGRSEYECFDGLFYAG